MLQTSNSAPAFVLGLSALNFFEELKARVPN